MNILRNIWRVQGVKKRVSCIKFPQVYVNNQAELLTPTYIPLEYNVEDIVHPKYTKFPEMATNYTAPIILRKNGILSANFTIENVEEVTSNIKPFFLANEFGYINNLSRLEWFTNEPSDIVYMDTLFKAKGAGKYIIHLDEIEKSDEKIEKYTTITIQCKLK